MEEKGITAYRMAVDLGFPQSTVSEWLAGAYIPKADKLLKIAEYLEVPVEELIRDETSKDVIACPE
jgi:transcriptional regulator with XRE-family HTH domain